MYYGGIDAHKTYLTVVIVDKDGNEVHRDRRVPIGDGEPLMATLEGFRPLEVVVETCPFWPWIHDRLESTDIGFHLAHASDLGGHRQSEDQDRFSGRGTSQPDARPPQTSSQRLTPSRPRNERFAIWYVTGPRWFGTGHGAATESTINSSSRSCNYHGRSFYVGRGDSGFGTRRGIG